MPQPSEQYRYRTATVCGPWRNTRQEALADAFRRGLALKEAGEFKLLGFCHIEKTP